jgi:A/G-specific adenine glycosylase
VDPAGALLVWYDAHRRDLPWRATADPYRIWVSEVMLQQTRVETVLPYYRDFLARFPTVEALASAEVDEVLAHWSGLGYYRRARQMHAAARRVAAAGEFPRTLDGLRELPGIGPYTAAAVASIAFGVVEPVLDGNVERLLARRLALAGDPKGSAGRAALLAGARALLAAGRPGASNQAMMELGATVCTPRRPKCLLCPLLDGCAAAREGDPERYPPPRRRRAIERQRRVVAVVERAGRVLLFRRPDDSPLLAGTWELPWFAPADGDEPEAAGPAALAATYGGHWRLGERGGRVAHGITFRALEVEVYRAEVSGGDGVAEAVGGEAGWFDAAARRRLPQSALVAKALRALAAADAVEEGAPAAGGTKPARTGRPGRTRGRRRG